MDNYANAGNFDRVYEDERVITAGDYDPDLAGVYLLGQDIQRVASHSTLEAVKQVIAQNFERLANDMVKTQRHLEDVEVRIDSRLRLLQQGLT